MESFSTKTLIIGSGAAGYTAAIYATRAGLGPVLVQGIQPGGQLTITTDVENYPGFADVVQGPWLMEQMEAQAKHVGTKILSDTIVEVDLAKRPFACTGDSGNAYVGETLIIATGAQARWLGLESEKKFQGFGVSACATCDGFFFRDKVVCVVGGGNTAVEEAMYLTNHASQVFLIHRRDKLRADKILQERLFRNAKIKPIWSHVVEEIIGTDGPPPGVTGVRMRDVKSDESQALSVDGVFIAIGHTPTTGLFEGQIAMGGEGYVLTAADSTQTSVPGVFAAGDVQDKIYRQAVTAAGTGCMAALEAEKFLAEAKAETAAAKTVTQATA